MYFDAHTHGYRAANALTSLYPKEWESLGEGEGYASVGFHPWILDENTLRDPFWEKLENLAREKKIVAIGEAGVDRLRCRLDATDQLKVFERHALLAKEFSLPLIIHSVRGLSDILSVRKKFSRETWMVHGFIGNAQEIGQLADKQIRISPGFALLAMNGNHEHKMFKELKKIPRELIYLESDGVSSLNIENIYEMAAPWLELSKQELAAQVWKNFQRDFLR